MPKGEIIMVNGKKVEPGESVKVEIIHKDSVQNKVYPNGYVRSMRFRGGLQVRGDNR